MYICTYAHIPVCTFKLFHLLYSILKIPSKLALFFYCRNIHVHQKEILDTKGPLLIAANHPNSFLDAIIIATLFKRPVYSLVRGDVYINRFYNKILTALKMMPVYRLSEGAQNLDQNYSTFSRCREIFKKNGIVLIFSEGRCVNEWKLRPLKKGTARLALSSWSEGIDLTILPAGINYQSFKSFGKNIQLNFGNPITLKDAGSDISYGKNIQVFNEILKKELDALVWQFDKADSTSIQKAFFIQHSFLKKILLTIPFFFGWLFHILPYLLVKFVLGRNFKNDHYDSVMVAGMFLLYPFYLLLVATILYFSAIPLWWLSFLIIPFTGWSYIQMKKQF